MRIGIFINDIHWEKPRFATTQISREALRRGHDVFYIGVEDFSYLTNNQLVAQARLVPRGNYRDSREYLAAIQGKKIPVEDIDVASLDVLLLRNDPALAADERPWAKDIGIIFGQEAARRGVLVLNDPNGLSKALNKLYFQLFPEEIRPKTLITRDRGKILRFIEHHQGKIVLKPLMGSGGKSVFLIDETEEVNLNQMIDAVMRDGYIIAQEYLPASVEGDVRVFMLNGEPLHVKGKYAMLRRINPGRDLRSNMHAGGRAEKAEITDAILRVAELVRPKLIQDGMFLVGLDVVGEKLIEVNVFSPGGLYSAQKTQRANFCTPVLEAIERKVECHRRNPTMFDNRNLAII